MTNDNNILEAWIMAERLSEGDISSVSSLPSLYDCQNQGFYSLFKDKLEEYSKKSRAKDPKSSRQAGGIVVYFDIFDFQEVVSILLNEYGLEGKKKDRSSGNKFHFALYFDRDFTLQKDMTFFTVSAYIRMFKRIPHEKEFRAYEQEQIARLNENFEEAETSPETFNQAMENLLDWYHLDGKSCRMEVVERLATEVLAHSFYITDLRMAQDIQTENLRAYLRGGDREQRVNLDSWRDSPNRRPGVFREILKPQNYPLGRFPSETKYALSLMQQVAVNLSLGVDSRTMRSVNGPPGTGKTTLLKDIFAELVVRQAYDITQLPSRRLKEGYNHFKNLTITIIPPEITENGIVVASSNNGAVQNIVNELPLSQGIDGTLLEALKEADYFYEIANLELPGQRNKAAKQTKPPAELRRREKEFWGMFSLEGGKADNMSRIRTYLTYMQKYLEEDYDPDRNVYSDFLKQYNHVMAMRSKMQEVCDSRGNYQKYSRELEEARRVYEKEGVEILNKARQNMRKLASKEQEYDRLLSRMGACLAEIQEKKTKAQENRNNMVLCLQALQKPIIPWGKKFDEYNKELRDIRTRIGQYQDEEKEYGDKESKLSGQIDSCSGELQKCKALQKRISASFAKWRSERLKKITALENRAARCKAMVDSSIKAGIQPLNMDLEYDDLQLSNPWFDESYREAQSRLFIAALRVRKEFLYENRKNLLYACQIWKYQNNYPDRPEVVEAAWNWINMAVPVISTTFASFSSMCRNLEPNSLGHLFIDEAGQAVPQAAVGAILRSRHVLVVGDPAQIKPVVTLHSEVRGILEREFNMPGQSLSDAVSVQTMVDAASRYGFYREPDQSEDSWIGIPLWVHRRCLYPMFTISNKISYGGLMVQGARTNNTGKTGWYNICGMSNKNYVKEQGNFLLWKIQELIKENPKIADPKEKDEIFVISPFKEVVARLTQKLDGVFTRRDENRNATNIGTIHTFQGREAPIVFLVLGADERSARSARWVMQDPNMMNVAATRAKREFYVIGNRELYCGLGCEAAAITDRVIRQYKEDHPELVDEEVPEAYRAQFPEEPEESEDTSSAAPTDENPAAVEAAEILPPKPQPQSDRPPVSEPPPQTAPKAAPQAGAQRVTGTISYLRKGSSSFYAYVIGDDGKDYYLRESTYSQTERAKEVIQKGRRISFVPKAGKSKPIATEVRADVRQES